MQQAAAVQMRMPTDLWHRAAANASQASSVQPFRVLCRVAGGQVRTLLMLAHSREAAATQADTILQPTLLGVKVRAL